MFLPVHRAFSALPLCPCDSPVFVDTHDERTPSVRFSRVFCIFRTPGTACSPGAGLMRGSVARLRRARYRARTLFPVLEHFETVGPKLTKRGRRPSERPAGTGRDRVADPRDAATCRQAFPVPPTKWGAAGALNGPGCTLNRREVVLQGVHPKGERLTVSEAPSRGGLRQGGSGGFSIRCP